MSLVLLFFFVVVFLVQVAFNKFTIMLKARTFSVTLIDCQLSYHPRRQGDVRTCPHDSLQSLLQNSTLALLPPPGPEYTRDELNILARAPAEFVKIVMKLSSVGSFGTVFWEVVDDQVVRLRLLYPMDMFAVTHVKGNLWIPLVSAWGCQGPREAESVRVCLRALTVLDDLVHTGAQWNASMCGSHKIYTKGASEALRMSPEQLNTVGFMLQREKLDALDSNWVSCGMTSHVSFSMATFQLAVRPLASKYRGGFVCDPPGSGKTMAALALTMMSPGDVPTLLVCPEPLVEQWQRIAWEKAPYLNAWTYRPLLPKNECHENLNLLRCKISVSHIRMVIASYEDVRADPLFQAMDWYRVIFDESHLISSYYTFLTPNRLRSPRRWCLTSAPFKNDIDPQLQAVGYLVWDPASIAALMQVASIRTAPHDSSPTKTMETVDYILPVALMQKATPMAADMDKCPICLHDFIDPVKTPCGHVFCTACIVSSLKHKETCPVCRASVGGCILRSKASALHSLVRDHEWRSPDFKALIISHDVNILKLIKGYFTSCGRTCSLVSSRESDGMVNFIRGKANILMVDASTSHLGLKLGKVTHIFFLERVTESKQAGILNMISSDEVLAFTLCFQETTENANTTICPMQLISPL